MTPHHLSEKFYSSINLVVNKTQPKKILFLAKVFCEEWLLPNMLTYSDDVHIDIIFLPFTFFILYRLLYYKKYSVILRKNS